MEPKMSFSLDRAQRRKIEKRRKEKARGQRIWQRLSALLWLDDGRTPEEVANLLGVARKTVARWVKIYRKHGLDELCTLHHKGDPGELDAEEIARLKAEIEKGRFRTAREACSWIKENFGKVYSISGVKRLLHRIGCSYHKTTGFLFKANRDKQKAFVKKYKSQKPKPGEATRRYFIDACHPIWGLELIYSCWLLRGQKFHVGMGGGRKRLSILGAISPEDHEYLDLRVPDGTITLFEVIELLDKLHRRHPETKKFILYLDNARYQHARLLKAWVAMKKLEGVEFVLEYLPAYSPNLNLIERLWRFLRKHALQQWYPTFQAMQDAVANVLEHLQNYREELQTLLTEKFWIVPDLEAQAVPTYQAAA